VLGPLALRGAWGPRVGEALGKRLGGKVPRILQFSLNPVRDGTRAKWADEAMSDSAGERATGGPPLALQHPLQEHGSKKGGPQAGGDDHRPGAYLGDACNSTLNWDKTVGVPRYEKAPSSSRAVVALRNPVCGSA
jgi:hypothetical protein